MIQLLSQGYYALFAFLLFALVFSLTFHEFGHASAALYFGDDTAKRAGRLTLNPLAHIDPLGLLMVIVIGFGFAKPVPVDPRRFNSFWGDLFVSAAGPAMNLLLAVVLINFYAFGLWMGWGPFQGQEVGEFVGYLALINMALMAFNLLPIGALDGHYILPYFLPRGVARAYVGFNDRYGNMLLVGLMAVSLTGVLPVIQYVWAFANILLGWVTFIDP